MAAVIRLEVSTPLADAVLMGRSNQPATLTAYDSFDVSSWTSSSSFQVYSAIVPAGDYYISVLNSRYGLEALNFTLYYEFSTLCPPSLTNSSNITSTLLDPNRPSLPCSGNGDPLSYCSNPSASVPPSTPVLCSCNLGWEGVYCEIPTPVITSGTPQPVLNLAPGQWQYFVFPANSSTVQLDVDLTQTSNSQRWACSCFSCMLPSRMTPRAVQVPTVGDCGLNHLP